MTALIPRAPRLFVKVLTVAGAVLASSDTSANPLPLADVEFTDTCYLPGQQQDESRFTLTLHDLKDSAYKYLVTLYALLNYQQRVEIYDRSDMLGVPAFAGIITGFSASLESNAPQVTGEGVLKYLKDRRVRRSEIITSNAATAIQNLLKVWTVTFKDNFNRANIGANWSVVSGTWSIDTNRLKQVDADGTAKDIDTVTTWTYNQWSQGKVSFDFLFSADAVTSQALIELAFDGANSGFAISSNAYGSNMSMLQNLGGAATNKNRVIRLDLDSWNHCDAYFTQESATEYHVTIDINGVEAVVYDYTKIVGTSAFTLSIVLTAGGNPAYFDNFCFAQLANALADNVSGSGVTLPSDFQSNGDSQKQVIDRICEASGWAYRVSAGSGYGNDGMYVDTPANIGVDYSDKLVFSEANGNIKDLTLSRAADKLATSLTIYGLASDDMNASYIANDFDAWDEFGIIEDQYNDQRIVDAPTARLLGDNQLALAKAGNVSISFTVKNDFWLQESAFLPLALRPGDYVWLKAPSRNIDKQIKLVSITHRSKDGTIDCVGDFFGWKRSDQITRLVEQYNMLYRNYINSFNTQKVILYLSGTTAQTFGVFLRGKFAKVLIDVTSQSWGGQTVTLKNNAAVDITNDVFGAATVGSDKHVVDTVHFAPYPEDPSLTMTFTPSGTVTIEVGISTQMGV